MVAPAEDDKNLNSVRQEAGGEVWGYSLAQRLFDLAVMCQERTTLPILEKLRLRKTITLIVPMPVAEASTIFAGPNPLPIPWGPDRL